MPRIPIPFNGPSFESRSPQTNDQLTVNWYPRPEQGGAKSKLTLAPTPGLTLLGTATNGPCRSNGVVFKGDAYFVSGNRLIKIDSSDTITNIGSLNTSDGRASIAAGKSSLMVTDGVNGYSYDGTTFAVIGSNLLTASYCEWVDNYFIIVNNDTNVFQISALDDPTTWSATDIASAEKRADNAVRPVWFRGDLMIAGTETCELYFNSGNADFPWDVYPNAVFEWGAAAVDSVSVLSNTVFMLASSREGGYVVLRMSSETPQIISNKDLEWQISQLSSISDAIGFAYRQFGHSFYQLTFPSANRTFVWDDTTQVWHERQSGTDRHRAAGHVFFNGKNIVGDHTSGKYYSQDASNYTDNGSTIFRIRRAPVAHKDRKRIFYNRLDIDFDFGSGLTSGQGSDPQAMLRWSDDGGYTWKDEQWRGIGKIGEYSRRARWSSIGASRNRVFELRVSDPVNVRVIDAYADIELGQD